MANRPIPERIRLVKLLRAHGLRDVERLRQDELKEALQRLGLSGSPAPVPPADLPPRSGPWSATRARRAEEEPVAPRAAPAVPADGRDERFDEPAVRVVSGQRSFLRLIAVEPGRVFATWDLDAHDRGAPGDAVLELRAQDGGEQLGRVVVNRDAHRWYLEGPRTRDGLVASLRIGDREVARSNICWPPPAEPAPPGRLILATVPVDIDRRTLRGGKLLSAAALGVTLPNGVTLDPTEERVGASDAPEASPAAVGSSGAANAPAASASSVNMKSSSSLLGGAR